MLYSMVMNEKKTYIRRMKCILAVLLLSIALSINVPTGVKVNLVSGSSISLSWNAVEEAVKYIISIEPTPFMSNDLEVETDYAFIDGLAAGQEYSIRVATFVHGVQSEFSEAIKVTPNGAPIIVPAPQIMSYDETSVTLSRHHIRHYRNGNDLNKIVVMVKEEGAEEVEKVYPFDLPLKIMGLTSGKSYSFAWRFGNSKGVQETYSRATNPITLKATSVPDAPIAVHLKTEEDKLMVMWRNGETGGRPVMKYNIRVSDLSGHVLFEKASYKSHVKFHNVNSSNGLLVEVNTMTAAGLSTWSTPYVYNPSHPSIMVMNVDAKDVIAVAHLNLTMPGAAVCSYYSSTIRPATVNREIHHMGHAKMILKDLQPESEYTVECSLYANGNTVLSNKATFTTVAHTESHITIADIEPYATFARISIKSDMPGAVRCMPMQKHFGDVSMEAFTKHSKRFEIKDAFTPVKFIANHLQRGSEYRLRCMMEHEMMHSLDHKNGRRLQESGLDISFATLSEALPVGPDVMGTVPSFLESVVPHSLITIQFDTPIVAGSNLVYVGNSLNSIDYAVTVESVSEHALIFRVPDLEGNQLYLYIPVGAVLSAESNLPNQEYRSLTNQYWTLIHSARKNMCYIDTPILPVEGGIIRFHCEDPVIIPTTCTARNIVYVYQSDKLLSSQNQFAISLVDPFEVGRKYTMVFTDCNLDFDTTEFTVESTIPAPVVITITPTYAVNVNERYVFTITFDSIITLNNINCLSFMKYDGTPIRGLEGLEPYVSGRSFNFAYSIPEEVRGDTLKIVFKKDGVRDNMGRDLPEDITILRTVADACGPTYLNSLTKSDDVCRCRRSSTRCECHCGGIGAAIDY